MIKHGKIMSLKGRHISMSHLEPIKEFVKKGIADAHEKIVLLPKACDVKGAKRHNGQQCVIAKALSRTLKPQAVAVGRSLAYAVFNGLAIRFCLPKASREMLEEFDQRGRARSAPVELHAINQSWRYGARKRKATRAYPKNTKRNRTKQFGVRAVGGGISA